jgi:hypothetical protein
MTTIDFELIPEPSQKLGTVPDGSELHPLRKIQREEYCAPVTIAPIFIPKFGGPATTMWGGVQTEEYQRGSWLKQNMLSRPAPNVAARGASGQFFGWFFGRFSDFLRFTEWGANRVAEGGV